MRSDSFSLDVRRFDQRGPFLDLALNKFLEIFGRLALGRNQNGAELLQAPERRNYSAPPCSRAASSDCRHHKPIAGAPRGRKDVFIRAFSFPSASLRLYDPVSRALEPDVRRREFLGALSRSPAVGS